MSRYLSVTKFNQYQHYKNRKPPWVKFYTSLVNPSHPLNELPIEARYLFDRMLLLAAEWENAIPNDSELIARLVAMPPRTCRESIDLLLKGRWLCERKTNRRASTQAASKSLPPETETERERNLKAVNGSRGEGTAHDSNIREAIVHSLAAARQAAAE